MGSRIRTSRKAHTCAACGKEIPKGAQYRDARSRARMGVATRTHVNCQAPLTAPSRATGKHVPLPRLDGMGRCQADPWYDPNVGLDPDEHDLLNYNPVFTSVHDSGW